MKIMMQIYVCTYLPYTAGRKEIAYYADVIKQCFVLVMNQAVFEYLIV